MQDHWSDVPLVLALARSGTLAGAARDLGIDATTIGRRITALEKRAGTKLFERTVAGFTLAAHAQEAVADAERMEDAFLGFQRRLAARDRPLRGRVRIAVDEPFCMYFLFA